jgi:hypothetical protein
LDNQEKIIRKSKTKRIQQKRVFSEDVLTCHHAIGYGELGTGSEELLLGSVEGHLLDLQVDAELAVLLGGLGVEIPYLLELAEVPAGVVSIERVCRPHGGARGDWNVRRGGIGRSIAPEVNLMITSMLDVTMQEIREDEKGRLMLEKVFPSYLRLRWRWRIGSWSSGISSAGCFPWWSSPAMAKVFSSGRRRESTVQRKEANEIATAG